MIEYFRRHVKYLWNAARREPQGRTIDLKKTEHSDSLNNENPFSAGGSGLGDLWENILLDKQNYFNNRVCSC